MRYKLVALDIDGTLLNSESALSERMRSAVRAAHDAGLIVTLATGRRYVTTRHFVRELNLREALILQTGALIVDPHTGQPLHENPLPPGAAEEALRIIVSQGLQPIIYQDAVHEQHLYTGPQEHDSRGASAYFAGNPDTVRRLPHEQLLHAEGVGGAPLELAVIDDLPPLERAVPLLQLAGCRTIISYSGNLDSYFMEVFGATCSKGEALARLAGWRGLTLADTVAVGDNYNDVEMLAMAGLGVAMGNAVDEVRAHARASTLTNDEDGAALVIEQILSGAPIGV